MKNKQFIQFLNQYDLDNLDEGLLRQAFTHSSASTLNNERLEFLGDAVLDSVLSQYLYQDLPHAQEHYMTRLRAYLVNKQALAKIASELCFYEYLILGAGEKQTGGHKRDSNLADAFEALLGAILLTGGYEKVKSFILDVYSNALSTLPSENSLKDAKTRLQEWLQKRNMELPEYRILAESGKPHDKTFVIEGTAGTYTQQAKGKSRKEAEQKAAHLLLNNFSQP